MGECTGGVAPSSPFVMVGIGVASSSPFTVHRCPSFVCVLAVERLWAVDAGDAGDVALVVCVRPVVARGGRAWFWWALVVICALSCRLRVVMSFARCRVICAMSCHLRVFVVFVRRSWRLLSFVDGWDRGCRWA